MFQRKFNWLRPLGQITTIIIAVTAMFTVSLPNAWAHSNGPNEPYTKERLEVMDLQELLAVAESFNTLVQDIQNGLSGQETAELPKTIRNLGKFHMQESFSALMVVAHIELRRFGNDAPAASQANLTAALDGLIAIATGEPSRNREEFTDLMGEAKGQVGRLPVWSIVANRLNTLMQKMNSRSEKMVDLNELISNKQNSLPLVKGNLAKLQEVLEERLIGQPEVIQALMDLEWKNALYGNQRLAPDAIYLMGLPGTGKDTAAEALADGLHDHKGAHMKHLFKLPIMKARADLWQVLGSATGYVGSQSFPPFLEFLVLHSGGRYLMEEIRQGGSVTYRVIENPAYKGKALPGYFSPNTAVVFVNEFHNWSKQLKDDFLKQALEKGYFQINNPNGGLTEVYVPVRFVIASNEGIGLVTSREANGQRHGKAMTYEQTLAKWEKVQANKKALKSQILAGNGAPNLPVAEEGAPGVSEELLNRIPDRMVLLMRPLSPDDLKKIVKIALDEIVIRLSEGSSLLNSVKLTYDTELLSFIQGYDYSPEENARPVRDRITSLIEEPLIDAVRSERLMQDGRIQTIHLSLSKNSDQTQDLVMTVNNKTELRQPIRATEKDRPREPISDSRIDQLANLEHDLKSAVFGVDSILERLAQRVVSLENETSSRANRPVSLILLTGLSSTGKTETAKQLSQKLTGSDDELVTFDFSQIQTLHDFKTRILGIKDGLGNPIQSEFMKHYDRTGGRMVVAFDELANVRDPDLLKCLYDLFREPVVTTFSDGKPRPMGGVMIIITGNAGQELYDGVPRQIPMEIQMAAWQEIFEQTNRDFELQRRVLEKYYPAPLITRIGRNNIFFMPPHTYKSLRQLAQLKLDEAIKRIGSIESRRGWTIAFKSDSDYKEFVATIVDEGFSLRYQGASIDSFVRDDFEEPLKYLLLKNKVPSGSTVVMEFTRRTDNTNEEVKGEVVFTVRPESAGSSFELKVARPPVKKQMKSNPTNQIITAFHEAGHSVVRQALFKDAYVGTKITVVPGVALIGDQWIYYAGVASSIQEKEIPTIHEWVVRQIAVLAAGETAERLVSRGETHSIGKSNDIERASKLARDAIIRYGLSPSWGIHAVPGDMSTEAYLATLSDKQRTLLEKETQNLIKKGRELAMSTLEANFDKVFVPLGVELAEKGELNQDDLKKFYDTNPVVSPEELSTIQRLANRWRTRVRKFKSPYKKGIEVELDHSIPKPKVLADVREIAAALKRNQMSEVPLPDNAPILSCERLLTGTD